MRKSLELSAAGLLAISLVAASVAPSLALPGARSESIAAEKAGVGSSNAAFRRHFYRGQAHHGGWHERDAWRDRGLGAGALAYGGAALGAGIAGALIDGTVGVAEPVMGSEEAMDAAMAYCADRFKSYDPSTGTYMGYDGNAHACPEG